MTIQPIIARAGFPLMVVAGATVFLAAVAFAPEIGGAGLIGVVILRSLLVCVQGLVLVRFVHNTDQSLRVMRARQASE